MNERTLEAYSKPCLHSAPLSIPLSVSAVFLSCIEHFTDVLGGNITLDIMNSSQYVTSLIALSLSSSSPMRAYFTGVCVR